MTGARGNTLYLVLGALVVVAGIVLAVLGYGKAERNAGIKEGETRAEARWLERDNEAIRKLGAAVVNLQGLVRQREAEAAEKLAHQAGLYEEELQHAQNERDRFMDDLASGRVRFGAGLRCPAGDPAGRGRAETAAAAGAGDGAEGGELPPALQAAVAGGARLAAEADEVARQLQLAQKTILTYRDTCR